MKAGRGTYGTPSELRWGGIDAELIVGQYCSIAAGVTVLLGGEHRTDTVTTYPFSVWPQRWPGAAGIDGRARTKGDVVIGNDVWIGLGAMILSGVHIGDGAVVGAGAGRAAVGAALVGLVGGSAQRVPAAVAATERERVPGLRGSGSTVLADLRKARAADAGGAGETGWR